MHENLMKILHKDSMRTR